jgi:hypothetical protein
VDGKSITQRPLRNAVFDGKKSRGASEEQQRGRRRPGKSFTRRPLRNAVLREEIARSIGGITEGKAEAGKKLHAEAAEERSF